MKQIRMGRCLRTLLRGFRLEMKILDKRYVSFLQELTKLSIKHKIEIGGCKCCGSPWVSFSDDMTDKVSYRLCPLNNDELSLIDTSDIDIISYFDINNGLFTVSVRSLPRFTANRVIIGNLSEFLEPLASITIHSIDEFRNSPFSEPRSKTNNIRYLLQLNQDGSFTPLNNGVVSNENH
jgi:hypothetical protein